VVAVPSPFIEAQIRQYRMQGISNNLVKAYDKYKTKNFTVLGVSFDRPGKKDDWLAAIKDDSLEWTQVSDLKF